jgi:hypothetical protein
MGGFRFSVEPFIVFRSDVRMAYSRLTRQHRFIESLPSSCTATGTAGGRSGLPSPEGVS